MTKIFRRGLAQRRRTDHRRRGIGGVEGIVHVTASDAAAAAASAAAAFILLGFLFRRLPRRIFVIALTLD